MGHLDAAALAAGLDHVHASPGDRGQLVLIVRRPAVGKREVLAEGVLSHEEGLVGDRWRLRGSRSAAQGGPHPDRQVTLMNARVAALVAGHPDRRPLAGDQLYVDLDLSEVNLPPGTRLGVGGAVIEITAEPHLGCGKFAARFGREALRWVNSPVGRALRLRGVNARVVVAGAVRCGDEVRKIR